MPAEPLQLQLVDIAAWQIRSLVPDYAPHPGWVAALPSLQRDAVWKPGQVELLWDSLFRGFPCGSLVVSERLEHQESRHGKQAGNQDPWPEPEIQKRHLLDGQQRSNAIALGFFDPFPVGADIDSQNSVGSILWLDLFPESTVFQGGGTRHFFVRLTTSAHPWGYAVDDEAGRLPAYEMQEVLRILRVECGWKPPQNDPFQRPSAASLWPAKATTPIPVAWLLLEAIKGTRGSDFWDAVRSRCEASGHRWARKAAQELAVADPAVLLELESGLRRALSTTVLGLEVPAETIRAKSKQESGEVSDPDSSPQNLSNVEHLFQRLNNGGTPISTEELQYSMIKAYWPGIEGTIGRLHRLPMRASRLAMLGSRAALATERPTPATLPGAMSISGLRALATDPHRAEKRRLVENFFELSAASHEGRPPALTQPTLPSVVTVIDEWLLHRGNNDIGLPPALRTSIAHQSPEVYLLLMVLAGRVLADRTDPEPLRTHVLGLATALHWFCLDQHRAVQRVYAALRGAGELIPTFFAGLLHSGADEQDNNGLLDLVTPATLETVIVSPTADAGVLEAPEWVDTFIRALSDGQTGEGANLENPAAALVWRILWQKELLIFAQRQWLSSRFKAFDKADASAWEDHNRPWDYDHLLPQTNFKDVRNARYLRVCQRWGGTIGNFHILPFEDNRSRGKTAARDAFATCELGLMLIEPDELDSFSLTRECVRSNGEAVIRFVQATRRRILAIYEDWYSSLDLPFLLNPPTPTQSEER